jgi:hypothetical protein
MSENLKTQPVNFIRFHGLPLLVVENNGVEYVEVKPLNDLIGMNWRRTSDTVRGDDNAALYGTRALIPPTFNEFAPSSDRDIPDPRGRKNAATMGDEDVDAPEISARSTRIYIRLDRARMFLARVNTAQMRVQGNANAADALLALQTEWASALHSYETNGVAVKKAGREARADLQGLFKTRALSESPQEKRAITRLIAEAFAELGQPLEDDPQADLDLRRA